MSLTALRNVPQLGHGGIFFRTLPCPYHASKAALDRVLPREIRSQAIGTRLWQPAKGLVGLTIYGKVVVIGLLAVRLRAAGDCGLNRANSDLLGWNVSTRITTLN